MCRMSNGRLYGYLLHGHGPSSMPLHTKLLILLGIFGLIYFHCNGRSRKITVIIPAELLINATNGNNFINPEGPGPILSAIAAPSNPAPKFFTGASDTSPEVLDRIRTRHLIPPSTKPYKFKHHLGFLTTANVGVPIYDALENKTNGFFIECGANDGEFLTNTLRLEAKFQWNGLLIESSPSLFEKLKLKNRKSWISDACLSGKIEMIEFLKSKKTDKDWRIGNGKINPGNTYEKPRKWQNEVFKREDYISEGMVECFPLQSILAAMNVTTVDFFSLDVEGHEYKILKAIPFDKIDIKVLFVEHWLAPEGKQAIQDLMVANGYTTYFENDSNFIFKKMENDPLKS